MLRLSVAVACTLFLTAICPAQTSAPPGLAPIRAVLQSVRPVGAVVPGRYVVIYTSGSSPSPAARTSSPLATHAQTIQNFAHLGISINEISGVSNGVDEASAVAQLAAQPGVEAVLHDRYVSAHRLSTVPPAGDTALHSTTGPIRVGDGDPLSDALYNSPQGWAVRQAGGFGAGVPGGPSVGPWSTGMGAGVRIAILDSGVDATHPDIAPNLALNRSEIDQTALPSPCDDGSPQDQEGHGTWSASLAAGALGTGTGGIIGVAPQATLLNIKVLQRMPAATGTDLAAQCSSGQAGGLLSWVLAGIEDAINAHADVISFSLGTIVDLNSGDGAGWKASFDRITHVASSAGIVLIAAVGNDGLDLSGGRYIELPAQARDVLPIVASTSSACAQNLTPNAPCAPGPVTRPYYSNFGTTLAALAAPGGSYPDPSETGVSGWIRGACTSGKPGTTNGLPNTLNTSFGCFGLGHTSYVQAMGTSASAPLVAGVTALLRAAHPDWTAAHIVSALRSSAVHGPAMAEPQVSAVAALQAP